MYPPTAKWGTKAKTAIDGIHNTVFRTGTENNFVNTDKQRDSTIHSGIINVGNQQS